MGGSWAPEEGEGGTGVVSVWECGLEHTIVQFRLLFISTNSNSLKEHLWGKKSPFYFVSMLP